MHQVVNKPNKINTMRLGAITNETTIHQKTNSMDVYNFTSV